MAETGSGRPGSSAAGYPSTISPSPRPSVASRTSQSSLRRDRDRDRDRDHHEASTLPRPSVAHSNSPQPAPAPEGLGDPAPLSSSPPSQPSFTPIFTLLASSTHPSQRQTTHHPTVHYIFADDDADDLTAALAHHHRAGSWGDREDAGSDSGRDRAILLDMAPAIEGPGFEVVWASSLSPDWAVVSARVGRMEGGDGGSLAVGRSSSLGALVLRIEGVSLESPSGAAMLTGPVNAPTPEADLQSSGASGTRQQQPAGEEYTGLLLEFEKRMGVLRRVVEAGGEKHCKDDGDQPEGGAGRD
ncbi:hypothetical protein B0T26DRAFT_651266 [Lasiosphaeria miniovina]|uniref:Uncharacterized protein n=1 Tax=Lasiosphaeria miniovina TaxID=1954250 RepID=A0AA40ADX5_9PEZI|nr:uncharacterized protein B0T26DRAFT_651266 [Lasiosphaeria miniovina]KAK0713878.1 hypothetical protein B0T26DRAFT_651266 [Lasiosphaeria miniovina]